MKKPVIIITCGLTGTGKSTIINEVAERTGFTVLTSDRMRKELVGIRPEEHRYEAFDSGIYSKEFTERTYSHMIEQGKKKLMEGESVILDACFPKTQQREMARRAGEEAGAGFLCIEFTAPEDEIRHRLDARVESGGGISDGRWEIYLGQKESYEDIDEFNNEEYLIINTVGPKEDSVQKILDKLES
jgi:predicted kinase